MKDIVKRLEIKAGVMEMGERIQWGSDTALMREAAAHITTLTAELENAKEKLSAADDAMEKLIATVEASANQVMIIDAELERKQREVEGLRAVATQYAASLGFVEPDEKLAKDLAALSQGEKE